MLLLEGIADLADGLLGEGRVRLGDGYTGELDEFVDDGFDFTAHGLLFVIAGEFGLLADFLNLVTGGLDLRVSGGLAGGATELKEVFAGDPFDFRHAGHAGGGGGLGRRRRRRGWGIRGGQRGGGEEKGK